MSDIAVSSGIDSLGLTDGVTFEQLAIAQGAGATLISLNSELLAFLTGVEANSIGSEEREERDFKNPCLAGFVCIAAVSTALETCPKQ